MSDYTALGSSRRARSLGSAALVCLVNAACSLTGELDGRGLANVQQAFFATYEAYPFESAVAGARIVGSSSWMACDDVPRHVKNGNPVPSSSPAAGELLLDLQLRDYSPLDDTQSWGVGCAGRLRVCVDAEGEWDCAEGVSEDDVQTFLSGDSLRLESQEIKLVDPASGDTRGNVHLSLTASRCDALAEITSTSFPEGPLGDGECWDPGN